MSDPDGLSEAMHIVSCLELCFLVLIGAAVAAWAAWARRKPPEDDDQDLPF